jgi:L-threonylcarbamoyladenylate synthase
MEILKVNPVRDKSLNGVNPKNLFLRDISRREARQIIEKTLEFLKKGKVVVFPTDTVYGLICDAQSRKAVEKIFKIKKRPKNKPLPIFVSDIEIAKEIAIIDKKQAEFLRKFWPGKITTRLERKKTKIKLYGVDRETIAIRIPKYELLLNLVKQLNRPLAQTSVNLSGRLPCRNVKEIISQFQNQKYQPDLIIDAGKLLGKSSKIIDLTVWPPKILRL